MPSPHVLQIIDHFQRILETDGGKLECLDTRDGVLYLNYAPGHNEACESCVLSPEDLRELVAEAVQRGDPSVREVNLVTSSTEPTAKTQ